MPSIGELRHAAENGDPESCFQLGLCYEKGKVVEIDHPFALSWYMRVVRDHPRRDDPGCLHRAMYRIAVLKESGLGGVERDLHGAIEWYEKAAELGHEAAISVLHTKRFELAWLLEKEGRLNDALHRYKQSADAGHVLAKSLLPCKYFLLAEHFSHEQDLPRAVEWYKKAAAAGHRDAKLVLCEKQYELGRVHETAGESAEMKKSGGKINEEDDSTAAENFKRAMELFAKAAAGGLPNGRQLLSCKQYEMGLRCLDGVVGVPASSQAALKWFEQAAEKGHELAMIKLVEICGRADSAQYDPTATAKWVGVLGAKGYVAAQYMMGVIAETGRGIARDAARAAKWYELASEQGHIMACYVLGCWYFTGVGVDVDHQKAFGLFRKAATAHTDAIFNTGVCLELGIGCQRELFGAVDKYKEAAKKGHTGAMYNLAVCQHEGEGMAVDLVHAVDMYKIVADKGHAAGQYNYGMAHAHGLGTLKPNPQLAFEYLLRSANQRYAEACFAVGRCYQQGSGCTIDLNKAAEYWTEAAKQDHEMAQEWLLQIADQLETRFLTELPPIQTHE